MDQRRQKSNTDQYGQSKAIELAFNDSIGGLKEMQVWPKLESYGVAADTAVSIDQVGKFLLLLNTDTAIHYYNTGASGVAAPTGPTNGYPILPMSLMIVSLGDDLYLRTDSALVYAYKVDDDTYSEGLKDQP